MLTSVDILKMSVDKIYKMLELDAYFNYYPLGIVYPCDSTLLYS